MDSAKRMLVHVAAISLMYTLLTSCGDDDPAIAGPTVYSDTVYMRDYEYEERRVFDLGRAGEFQPGDSIITLIVYEAVRFNYFPPPPGAIRAIMYVNPNYPDSFPAQSSEFTDSLQGALLITENKYEYYTSPQENRHYVVFAWRRRDAPLGVYMKVRRASDTLTFGSIGDTVTLKLIYSPDESPHWETWGLMWRNCYPIPRGQGIHDFELAVYRGFEGTEGSRFSLDYQETEAGKQKYMVITGLDLYDNSSLRNAPDGKLDDREEVFRSDWGLVIFPHSRPFDNDTTYVLESGETQAPLERAPALYEYYLPTEKYEASRYFIRLLVK